MLLWPFAFSVAEWTCVDEDCRSKVSWAEHVPVYERGRPVGVRHPDCSDGQIRRAKAHDRDVKRDPYLRRDVAMLGGDPSL